jgi:hypothetical protein
MFVSLMCMYTPKMTLWPFNECSLWSGGALQERGRGVQPRQHHGGGADALRKGGVAC